MSGSCCFPWNVRAAVDTRDRVDGGHVPASACGLHFLSQLIPAMSFAELWAVKQGPFVC